MFSDNIDQEEEYKVENLMKEESTVAIKQQTGSLVWSNSWN